MYLIEYNINNINNWVIETGNIVLLYNWLIRLRDDDSVSSLQINTGVCSPVHLRKSWGADYLDLQSNSTPTWVQLYLLFCLTVCIGFLNLPTWLHCTYIVYRYSISLYWIATLMNLLIRDLLLTSGFSRSSRFFWASKNTWRFIPLAWDW